MHIGTQPVFYTTYANEENVSKIYEFIFEQEETSTIDKKVISALQCHFNFMQPFLDGENICYYEREWRLCKQNLAPIEMWNRNDNPRHHIKEAGYPSNCGKLFTEAGNDYFEFEKKYVAFLIRPRNWQNKICNPNGFDVKDYEKLDNRAYCKKIYSRSRFDMK